MDEDAVPEVPAEDEAPEVAPEPEPKPKKKAAAKAKAEPEPEVEPEVELEVDPAAEADEVDGVTFGPATHQYVGVDPIYQNAATHHLAPPAIED